MRSRHQKVGFYSLKRGKKHISIDFRQNGHSQVQPVISENITFSSKRRDRSVDLCCCELGNTLFRPPVLEWVSYYHFFSSYAFFGPFFFCSKSKLTKFIKFAFGEILLPFSLPSFRTTSWIIARIKVCKSLLVLVFYCRENWFLILTKKPQKNA